MYACADLLASGGATIGDHALAGTTCGGEHVHLLQLAELTNGHSKKIDNHAHAIALHFMHCNFARKHMTLKGKTPAMAAGLVDHVWSIDEIVAMLPEKTGRFTKIGALAASK